MNGSQRRGAGVFAFDFHDGAHRAALLERDLSMALSKLRGELRVVARGAAILAQQHEFAVAQYLAADRA